MANTKISQLPSYTGTAADLRWFVMNNSGETTTFKFSGYTSQYIPGSGQYSIRHYTNTAAHAAGNYTTILGDTSNNSTSDYTFIGGGINNNVESPLGGVVGGNGNTASYKGFVGGGQSNYANGNAVAIIGGESNYCGNNYCGGIFEGIQNKLYGGNDLGFGIFGGYVNTIASNGGQGITIIGGSTNRIRNFDSSGEARLNYGSILGGFNNFIGYNPSAGGGDNSGMNAYPSIINGYNNQILGGDIATAPYYRNYYSHISNSKNCIISGGTTGATIIGCVDTIVDGGKVNAVMIGTSGKTAVASNSTHLEALVLMTPLTEYANNTAAKAGGLVDGQLYRDNSGAIHIVFT